MALRCEPGGKEALSLDGMSGSPVIRPLLSAGFCGGGAHAVARAGARPPYPGRRHLVPLAASGSRQGFCLAGWFFLIDLTKIALMSMRRL